MTFKTISRMLVFSLLVAHVVTFVQIPFHMALDDLATAKLMAAVSAVLLMATAVGIATWTTWYGESIGVGQ